MFFIFKIKGSKVVYINKCRVLDWRLFLSRLDDEINGGVRFVA